MAYCHVFHHSGHAGNFRGSDFTVHLPGELPNSGSNSLLFSGRECLSLARLWVCWDGRGAGHRGHSAACPRAIFLCCLWECHVHWRLPVSLPPSLGMAAGSRTPCISGKWALPRRAHVPMSKQGQKKCLNKSMFMAVLSFGKGTCLNGAYHIFLFSPKVC